VIGGVLALLLFVVGGGGGYYYFTTGQIPSINKAESEKVNQHKDGYAGQIQQNQQAANSNSGGSNPPPQPVAGGVLENYTYNTGLLGGWQAQQQAQTNPTQFKKDNEKAANNGAALVAAQVDGNTTAVQNITEQIKSGATVTYTPTSSAGTAAYNTSMLTSNAQIAAANAYNDYLTTHNLVCDTPNAIDGSTTPVDSEECKAAHAAAATAYGNAIGHECMGGDSGCPIACSSLSATERAAYTNPTSEPGGGTTCNGQGQKCSLYRNEMMTTAVPGPTTKWCFLSYGEQCGGNADSCTAGTYTNTTTTDTTPTMACTGITSAPAVTPTAPVIGNKITFTCAGTVTPATAGTLSYKFRYNIDNGTYKSLTNKTPTTAELSIAACGSYSVECQACATLNGVVTCDPVWTGASTQ
jgi:hypothetical protein